MTSYNRFDRIEPRLPELLTELVAPSVPDYTNDILARTSATRQRPRWTFIERWFPMGVIARERVIGPTIPWRAIALAAVLLALVASALLIAGAQRRVPPPFGLASNGVLLHDRDGDIYVRDSLTSEPRLLVGGPEHDLAPGFSRDGTRVVFLRLLEDRPGSPRDLLAMMVADLDGSHVRQLTGGLDTPDWFDPSPDDKEAVVQMTVNDMPGLHLLDFETGATRPLHVDMPAWTPNWRGPDGREIIFRGWTTGDTGNRVGIMAIRPDGTGLRVLTPLEKDLQGAYQFPQVSPDGRYVIYSAFAASGGFRVHLLEIDTGRIEVLQLGPAGGHQGFASFSPDGTLLLFHWISNDNKIQEMLVPFDRSRPAVPVGPVYPIVNGSADLQQAFSPDGKLVIITQGRDRETRLVKVDEGGLGTVLPWDAESIPSWQRLPRGS